MRVFLGGPVATDKLAFASLRWSRRRRELKCVTHLSVEAAMHELSMGRDVRGFVGYSGWSEGQLEGELRRHSWIVSPPQPLIVADPEPDALWSAVLCEMGPVYEIMSRMPDDVSLN